MDLINQLSWSACFEQRGNQQRRRSLGKWLLEEGGGCGRGCVGVQSWRGERWRKRICSKAVQLIRGWSWGEGGSVCWRIIHPACIAAGSRLSLVLPAHWKHFPKAGWGVRRGAGCLLFLRRSSVVAGKGAMGSPFLCVAPAIWQASTL